MRAIGPGELEGARLPDALAKVAGGWAQRNGVPAAFTTTGTPRTVHPEVEVTLLRAAQEALANVARHARATRVGLTLSYMEDLVTLDVRDDGVGFEPSAHRLRPDRDAPARAGRRRRARGRVRARRGHRDLRERAGVISLLIADDHPVVRNGLRGIFTGDPDFEVLGEAATASRPSRSPSPGVRRSCSWTCGCRAVTA